MYNLYGSSADNTFLSYSSSSSSQDRIRKSSTCQIIYLLFVCMQKKIETKTKNRQFVWWISVYNGFVVVVF